MSNMDAATYENASYEVQTEKFLTRRTYSVRVTPIPSGTWCLQAQTHKYRPYLRYWAMATVQDNRNPTGRSTWTLWFVFREPPMEHLDKIFHDGLVMFLAEDEGPHYLFVPGFTVDLFVGRGGTIAKAEILESQKLEI
jgi:hypothetical protein